jgi:hypothetical protein
MISLPFFAFQTLTLPYKKADDPETRHRPSGLYATEFTLPVCPAIDISVAPALDGAGSGAWVFCSGLLAYTTPITTPSAKTTAAASTTHSFFFFTV